MAAKDGHSVGRSVGQSVDRSVGGAGEYQHWLVGLQSGRSYGFPRQDQAAKLPRTAGYLVCMRMTCLLAGGQGASFGTVVVPPTAGGLNSTAGSSSQAAGQQRQWNGIFRPRIPTQTRAQVLLGYRPAQGTTRIARYIWANIGLRALEAVPTQYTPAPLQALATHLVGTEPSRF